MAEKRDNRLDDIRKELDAIREQLTKQNRDSLDAMYNIGLDNLDEQLTGLISKTGNAIASISLKTDENSATITALAEWIDGTGNDSLSGFIANATKDYATTSMLSEYTKTDDVNNLINNAKSGIIADARSGMATISMLSEYTTTDEVNGLISNAKAGIITEAQDGMATVSMISSVTNSAGRITAASIVAAVNDSGSSVMIEADKVNITGFVTFDDLATEGATTINGSNISLLSDVNGDSEMSFVFKKDNGKGTTDPYERFFEIYTVDNSSESDDEARYAVFLRTYKAYDGNTAYNTALKLKSNGSMSLESGFSIYMRSLDFMTLDPECNLGVRSYLTSTKTFQYLPNGAVSDTYYFCTDGIYYGSKKIVSV